MSTGTKEEAYKHHSFSMYEERCRNTVKNSGGGKFKVYVEDVYMYNYLGTEKNLADTEVYIYNVQ